MLRIGITGGIGSGKSIVSRLFAALGVPVYDSDSRARWLMENDALLGAQLQTAFGPETFAEQRLNRAYLVRNVLPEPALLAQLNGLVHPQVGEDFEDWAAAQTRAGHSYGLKEAALLYESGAYQQLARIIAVAAPVPVRVARVLRRDPQRTAAEVAQIMSKQLDDEEKQRRAQHVVLNDDQHLVLPQVLALDAEFRRLAAAASE